MKGTHLLEQVDGVCVRCQICHQEFHIRADRGSCPGVRVYGRTTRPPDLLNYRELKRVGLVPRAIQQPDGAVIHRYAKPGQPTTWIWLYKREEARPVRRGPKGHRVPGEARTCAG